jgi:hypothetical protein
MSVDQIQMSCPCVGHSQVFFTATRGSVPEQTFLQAWKNDAAAGGHRCTCSTCGCTYVTEDDGVPAASGGSIQLGNKSQPRIDSISGNTSGSTAGGTSVTVNGHAFNAAAPTVKFDGVAGANLVVVSDSELTVDTPAGKVALNVAEYHTKLAHGSVSGGPFTVGETVTGGTSAATGVVTQVEAAYLMVKTVTGVFEDAETITGGTSGASAALSAAPTVPVFSASETVTGQTSAVTAVVQVALPLKVDTLSGSFSASEEILGGTSAARATLSAAPMNGAVDVSIENANGARAVGGVAAGAFQYVP